MPNHVFKETVRIETIKYHVDLVVKTPDIRMDENIIPIQYIRSMIELVWINFQQLLIGKEILNWFYQ